MEPELRELTSVQRELMDPFEVYSLLNPEDPYDEPELDSQGQTTPATSASPAASPVFSEAVLSRSSSISLHSEVGSRPLVPRQRRRWPSVIFSAGSALWYLPPQCLLRSSTSPWRNS